jgi:hypothetical protein
MEHVERRLKEFALTVPREFTGTPGSVGVVAKALENPAKLKLFAYWELTHTAEDIGRAFDCRSKMLMAMIASLNEVSRLHGLWMEEVGEREKRFTDSTA